MVQNLFKGTLFQSSKTRDVDDGSEEPTCVHTRVTDESVRGPNTQKHDNDTRIQGTGPGLLYGCTYKHLIKVSRERGVVNQRFE